MCRSTFCTAFYSGALERMTTPSIIFILFINLALCISFTILAYFTARPPRRLERWNGVLFKRVSKEETIAMCFCCPAKTQGTSFTFYGIARLKDRTHGTGPWRPGGMSICAGQATQAGHMSLSLPVKGKSS